MTEYKSPIIQDTFELSRQLRKEAKTSWFMSIVNISELIHNPKEPCSDSQIELKRRLSKIVINVWHTKRNYYSQGKLKLYASLKDCPGFEQYLNLSDTKLRQAINNQDQNKCTQFPN